MQVPTIEVETGLNDTRNDGRGETEPILSERVRIESCTAYLVDFEEEKKGPTARKVLQGHEVLETELRYRSQDSKDWKYKIKCIIAIHGLPVDYVEVLKGSSLLEADAVDSMSRRRPSRSLRKTCNQYLCYEYPVQLVDEVYDTSRPSQDLDLPNRSSSLDLLDDPPRYTSSESGREVAMCRATLRVNPAATAKPYGKCYIEILW